MVNDYNIILLILWEGNVDIKFISDIEGILNAYITAYLTKAEFGNSNELWNTINKSMNVYSMFKSIALKYLKNREIGIMEGCLKLLGFKYYEFSQNIIWLNSYLKQDRRRKIITQKELENLVEKDPNSNKFVLNNMIDSYYPARPDNLENMCLYDFASNYVHNYKIKKSNKLDTYELKKNLGFITKRTKPVFLSTPTFSPNNINREKYFHQIIILFKPWRNENDDLLLHNQDTYENSFKYFYEQKIISEKNTIFIDQQKRINEASFRLTETYHLLTNNNKDLKNTFLIKDTNKYEYYKEFLENINKNRSKNEIELNEKIGCLNNDQKQIFNDIIDHINKQMINKDNIKSFKKFTSGFGGNIFINF